MSTQSEKRNPKIILAIIEGLGFSSSWRGNAILSAKLPNLSRFWLDYPNLILKTAKGNQSSIGVLANPQIDHASIAMGNICLPNYDYIDQQISSGEFFNNSVITEAFDYAKKNFSSIHLVGNLSKNNLSGSKDHLKTLIDCLVQRKSSNNFVHLILDKTFSTKDEILIAVLEVEKFLARSHCARIASVSGEKNLSYCKSIFANSPGSILRKKHIALTADQAINLFYDDRLDAANFPAVRIKEGGKILGYVNDFDSIIFFNHNPAVLEENIFNLASTRLGNNRPRSLKVTLLTDQISSFGADIRVAFRQDFKNNLCRILAQNSIRQFLISSSLRINCFRQYFIFPGTDQNNQHFVTDNEDDYNFATLTGNLHNLVSNTTQKVADPDFDFVILDIPYLSLISKWGTFSQITSFLEKIDQELATLASAVTGNDVILLLTSNHHYNLESAKASSDNIGIIRVPLLAISNFTRPSSAANVNFANQIIYDLIKDNDHTLADIAPTILHLYGIPKPDSMTGQSLLPILFNNLI